MGSCVELAPWHPALHLINLKQTTATDTFNSMLYVDAHAAGVKAHSRNGLLAPVWCARPLLQRLWWSFFFSSIRFGTGHFQLVSSTTGHTKLINFLRTTPLPNGAAALRGPVHNVVMTRRSKVVWPVPQLRRKIAIARCIVFVWEEGGQEWPVYILIYGEKTFIPKWYKMLLKLQMLYVVHTENVFSDILNTNILNIVPEH